MLLTTYFGILFASLFAHVNSQQFGRCFNPNFPDNTQFNYGWASHEVPNRGYNSNNRRRYSRSVPDSDEQPPSSNIILGQPADPKKWPFYVSLLREGSLVEFDDIPGQWNPACGGTLIHPQFILTAAHCFVRKIVFTHGYLPASKFAVRVGDYSILAKNISTAETIKILRYAPHPEFTMRSFRSGNDIAIAQLERPIVSNNRAMPICLPEAKWRPSIHQPCQTAGRGAINRNGTAISSYPRETTLWVSGHQLCHSSMLTPRQSRDGRIFCAGDPDGYTDTCTGDSGGPIVCFDDQVNKWYFSGIISFGVRGCGIRRLPGGYTTVPYYRSWINYTMEHLLALENSTSVTNSSSTGNRNDTNNNEQEPPRQRPGISWHFPQTNSTSVNITHITFPLNATNSTRDALLDIISRLFGSRLSNPVGGTAVIRINQTVIYRPSDDNDDDTIELP